jgi:hypothetical protein
VGPGRRHGSARVAMTSLRDVAKDGFCVHLVIDHRPRANGVVRQGRRNGPSFTYKITPCWVTLLQPVRRAAMLGQPSSLRPHCMLVPAPCTERGEVELLDQTFPFCEECLHE